MANSSTFTVQPLTPSDRWTRFVDDELTTFVSCSILGSGFLLAKEYRSTAGSTSSRSHRLVHALQKTRPLLPALAFSTAVGIAGFKLSIAAVSAFREDYTRSSVLLALPLTMGLLQSPRGPRAMATGVIGGGLLAYGVDRLAFQWHWMNAEKEKQANQVLLLRAQECDHYDAPEQTLLSITSKEW